jgi:integration host factor subunit alpha
MTKNDIIDMLHDKIGFNKKETGELVDLIFDNIKGALASKKNVKISNFGNFSIRDKDSRMGRNPKTGEEIEISARSVVTFKPSQKLKEAINEKKKGKKK